MTKLTLLLDEKTIKKAKLTAKKNKTSVSKMAASYFESLTAHSEDNYDDLPVLKEISGVIYGKEQDYNPKKEYKKHIRKKYK